MARVQTLDAQFPPAARAKFLGLLANGYLRGAAARAIGVPWRVIRSYAEANLDFADEMWEAEQRASQPIIDELYQAAKDREPWAVKLWVEGKVDDFKKNTVNHNINVSGKIEVTAQTADDVILQLQERAAMRALEPPAPSSYEADILDIPEADVVETIPAPPPPRRVQ